MNTPKVRFGRKFLFSKIMAVIKNISFFFLILLSMNVNAQSRIADHNSIGWYNLFATYRINDKWSIHGEFQFRRDNLYSIGQQNLLRTGINYQPDKKLLMRLGYANIETYAYGDYPINSLGKNFSEHRIFEMIMLNDKIKSLDISHRFMLEQRFVGKYSSADLTKEDQFVFLNRLRYMLRMQLPLITKPRENNLPYMALYDELFVGFGKNVGENVFDQNRIGFLIGYKFNKILKLEIGYLNQILQLGREIENKNVFQYNRGIICNTILNL